MGNGMNKIIKGVYVGNFRDAKDSEQLEKHGITHILSIHDNAKALLEDKKYLCIVASDTPNQSLTEFFPQCTDFIHQARLDNGNVLIHCLAGVSRSVTVTAAYLMTATNLGWCDALSCIRGARNCANPNFGFQKQLQEFESEHLATARDNFRKKYPHNPFEDSKECEINLKSYRNFLTGEPNLSDNTYSLPHRAYGDRNKSQPKVNGQNSGEQNDVQSHGGSDSKEDNSASEMTDSGEDNQTQNSDQLEKTAAD